MSSWLLISFELTRVRRLRRRSTPVSVSRWAGVSSRFMPFAAGVEGGFGLSRIESRHGQHVPRLAERWVES